MTLEVHMRWVLTAAALLAIGGTARADAVDYIKDAKVYYRVVACMGSDPLPANLDAPTITKHCEDMAKRFAKFTEAYITKAQAFFAGVRPAGLPQTVVYPFGG